MNKESFHPLEFGDWLRKMEMKGSEVSEEDDVIMRPLGTDHVVRKESIKLFTRYSL